MKIDLNTKIYDGVLRDDKRILEEEIKSLERKIKNKKKLNDILVFASISCAISLIVQVMYQFYMGF